MLIGVEGADRAGKTSLLEPLAQEMRSRFLDDVVMVTRLPTPKGAFDAWSWVEPVYLHLLQQLYDPSTLYVTDRSMTLSGLVYSTVFERPCRFDPTPWYGREFIVYVEAPLDVLERRWREEGEGVFPVKMYRAVLDEYERRLPSYRHVRVDGTLPAKHNVGLVVEALKGFCAVW